MASLHSVSTHLMAREHNDCSDWRMSYYKDSNLVLGNGRGSTASESKNTAYNL